MGIWKEPRRRPVYRMTVPYAFAARVFLQIASIIFPTSGTLYFGFAFDNWLARGPVTVSGERRCP